MNAQPFEGRGVCGVLPIFLAALASCRSEEDDLRARREAETERAFRLEEEADLVIDYMADGQVWLHPDGAERDSSSFPAAELERRLTAVQTPRTLCVIIMSKKIQLLPQPAFKEKVDQLEDVLKRQGWSRVVVQLGRATGRPIYRE